MLEFIFGSLLLTYIWCSLGIIAGGYIFSYFQNEYIIIAKKYYKEDASIARKFALLGPIILAIVFVTKTYKYKPDFSYLFVK